MNYWKILPILFAATLITAACSAPQTKKSEPTSSEVAYEGPEYVETYETADGNPKQASHIVINKATLTLKLYDKRSRLMRLDYILGELRRYRELSYTTCE